MSDIVHADLRVLAELARTLARIETVVSSVTAGTSGRLGQLLELAHQSTLHRLSELRRHEAELEACHSARPPRDCGPEATAVARCEQRLLDARRAVESIEEAISHHHAAQARIIEEVSSLTGEGRRLLFSQRSDLERYLATGHLAAQ